MSFVVIFVAVAPTVDVPLGEMLRSCGVGTGVSVSGAVRSSVPEQRSGKRVGGGMPLRLKEIRCGQFSLYNM